MRASCYRSRFSWLRVCPGVKIIDGIFEVDCYCCRALISSFPFLLHPLVFPVFLSLSRFPHSNPGGAYVVKGQEYPVGRPHVTACGRSVADRPNLTEATEGGGEDGDAGERTYRFSERLRTMAVRGRGSARRKFSFLSPKFFPFVLTGCMWILLQREDLMVCKMRRNDVEWFS